LGNPGTYSPIDGLEGCFVCPPKSRTNLNATDCDCIETYYKDYSEVPDSLPYVCRPCPQGADCLVAGVQVTNIPIQSGWWPAISGISFIRCINEACQGGSGSHPSCADGYTGNLCSQCVRPGYGRTGKFDCSACPEPNLNRLRLFGLCLLLVVIVVVVTRITMVSARKRASKSSILLKIFLSNLQFNSLALSFDFQWPNTLLQLFTVFDSGSNVTGFLSVDCFLTEGETTSPFFIKCLVVLSVLPFLILGPALLVFLPYTLVKWCLDELPASRRKQLWEMYISGEVIVMFLLHPSVTSLALSLFSCKRLGEKPDDLFLMQDLGQRCYDDEHMYWLYRVGAPLVILFVVGVPLAAWIRLCVSSKRIVNEDEAFKEQFGFLYNGYRFKFWYWEFVVVIRKVLLVAISVYFISNLNVQALMAIGLVTVGSFRSVFLLFYPPVCYVRFLIFFLSQL
jgi:hypothetical protein